MELKLKVCTRCKVSKQRSEFRKKSGAKANKDGLNATCRRCDSDINLEYRTKQKNESPLKYCYLCQLDKHYSLFYADKRSYNKGGGYKCIECVIKIKTQKNLKQPKEKRPRKSRLKYVGALKMCSKCKVFQSIECFWKSIHTADGLYSSCITCVIKNREPRKAKNKQLQKDWCIKNKDRLNEYHRNYDKKRRSTDIAYRLRRMTMHAIIASMKKYSFASINTNRLTKAIFDHLPYTAEQLKQHLESLWEPWMNWNNHGKYSKDHQTWQIDHIIPQSKLIFTDFNDDNFKKLWALGNLRPLDTIENIRKGNKVIDEPQ